MTNADEFKQALEKNIRYGGWYFLGEVYGEYLVSYAEKMQEVMDRHRASNRFDNEDDLTPGDAFIMYLAIWLELTGNASSLGTELFNLGIKLSKAKRQKKEKELKETVKRMHEVVLGLVSADDETANIYDKGLRRSVNLLLMEITILIDALMHKPDDGTGCLLPINYDEPIMDEWPIQVVTRGMMEEPMIIAGMMYIIVKMQNYVLGTLQRIRNKQVPIEIDEEPIQVYKKAADRFKNFVVSSKVSTMQLTKLAKEISYAVAAGKKLSIHIIKWMKEFDVAISKADEMDLKEWGKLNYSLYLLSCWTVYIPRLMGEYLEINTDLPLHAEGDNKRLLS